MLARTRSQESPYASMITTMRMRVLVAVLVTIYQNDLRSQGLHKTSLLMVPNWHSNPAQEVLSPHFTGEETEVMCSGSTCHNTYSSSRHCSRHLIHIHSCHPSASLIRCICRSTGTA